MNLRKLSVVLLALLLAGMAMVPIVSAETISAQTNTAATSNENDVQKDNAIPELPDFMPGIKDKPSYEEMKRLMKTTPSSPPVPESEMARIIFAKTWFMQNDEDPQADEVQLTFPVTWLDTPPVSDDEAIVLLRIPKRLLELGDINSDPEMITVSYPVTRFREFSNLNAINLTPQVQKINLDTDLEEFDELSAPAFGKSQTRSKTTIPDKQVRAQYVRDTAYSVDAIKGYMLASGSSNTGGESFVNYNENEVYLDGAGDVIEFIIHYTDFGQTTARVSVYNNETWDTPLNWLSIDLTGLDFKRVEYELYLLSGGIYDIWMCEYSSGTWYHNQYTDTNNPSTYITWMMGSTELDTVGGISKKFSTWATIRATSTRSGTTWFDPEDTFNWFDYTPDEQYVAITSDFEYNDIRHRHHAGTNW